MFGWGEGSGDELGEQFGGQFAAWFERLDVTADPDLIAAGFSVRDHLSCVLTGAVSRLDAERGCVADGALSTRAWLQNQARLDEAEAARTLRTARRLRRWPVTTSAWESGRLSAGQVTAIVNLVGSNERLVALFAEHETEIIAGLADLTAYDTMIAMRRWRHLANQQIDTEPNPTPEPDPGPDAHPDDRPEPEPEPVVQSLHLSAHFDGHWRLDANLGPEGGTIIDKAIDLATLPDIDRDIDGPGGRWGSERRADALVEICRSFLAHHDHGTAKPRNRPHINIVVDLPWLHGQAGRAETIEGLPLDRPTIERLLCDADIHRVITNGPSVILDYGRATRTTTPEQWNALLLRDRHCTWPAGCTIAAKRCHAHHEPEWIHSGTTNINTMRLLCTGHHWLRHQPGWHAKILPDTTYQVTSPKGKTFTSRPRC